MFARAQPAHEAHELSLLDRHTSLRGFANGDVQEEGAAGALNHRRAVVVDDDRVRVIGHFKVQVLVRGALGERAPGRAMLEGVVPVSYTHLRAHETDSYLVCRLL